MKRKVRKKAKPATTKRAVKTGAKRKAIKSSEAATLQAVVSANAKSLGIPLQNAWRAGTVFNFKLIMQHAALVDEFALSDEAEPAAVYRA